MKNIDLLISEKIVESNFGVISLINDEQKN